MWKRLLQTSDDVTDLILRLALAFAVMVRGAGPVSFDRVLSGKRLVLQFINTVTHREGRCAASGKAPRPRRTGQVR